MILQNIRTFWDLQIYKALLMYLLEKNRKVQFLQMKKKKSKKQKKNNNTLKNKNMSIPAFLLKMNVVNVLHKQCKQHSKKEETLVCRRAHREKPMK